MSKKAFQVLKSLNYRQCYEQLLKQKMIEWFNNSSAIFQISESQWFTIRNKKNSQNIRESLTSRSDSTMHQPDTIFLWWAKLQCNIFILKITRKSEQTSKAL